LLLVNEIMAKLASIKSISHFNVYQAILLILGLLFRKWGSTKGRFKQLVREKHGIDFLYRVNETVTGHNRGELLISGQSTTGNAYKFYIRRFTSDTDVFHQLYFRPDYPVILQKIQSLFQNQSVKLILDGGAYIGLSTFFWATAFKGAKVIAVEADRSNFEQLERNVALNNLLNVTCLHKALWHQEEQLMINTQKMDKRQWAYAVEKGNAESNNVLGLPIHKLVDLDKTKIDILKLDIEGAEKEVFLNDPSIEAVLNNVRIIICELHYEGEIRSSILNKITEFGFTYETIGEDWLFVNHNLVN